MKDYNNYIRIEFEEINALLLFDGFNNGGYYEGDFCNLDEWEQRGFMVKMLEELEYDNISKRMDYIYAAAEWTDYSLESIMESMYLEEKGWVIGTFDHNVSLSWKTGWTDDTKRNYMLENGIDFDEDEDDEDDEELVPNWDIVEGIEYDNELLEYAKELNRINVKLDARGSYAEVVSLKDINMINDIVMKVRGGETFKWFIELLDKNNNKQSINIFEFNDFVRALKDEVNKKAIIIG